VIAAPVRILATVAYSLSLLTGIAAQSGLDVCPPTEDGSRRFAVIGDSGTGGSDQYETGKRMMQARQIFPFDFVIMLGDNLYGSERPQDFVKKFEKPYQALLDAKVEFYAALGNHDDPNQRYYKPFHMNGERYYAFSKGPIRFFALDSNYFDTNQQEWLTRELTSATEPWKIAFFHHPLYSSGAKHGAQADLRAHLEPLFIRHGVSVVFSGHEHFYERLKPQRGIHYFTSGAAAKLREGNIRDTPESAKGLDQDNSFMLVEVHGDQLTFQTITRAGKRFDSGVLTRRRAGTSLQTAAREDTSSNAAGQRRPAPASGVTPLICTGSR
jgi:predicted phosphodiesterase